MKNIKSVSKLFSVIILIFIFGCAHDVDIPNVKGLNINVARDALRKVSKNFKITEENFHNENSNYKIGQIIKTEVIRNNGKSNADIKLYVCDAEYKSIPDIKGESVESARNKLKEIGLNVNDEYLYDFSDLIEKGICIGTKQKYYFSGNGVSNDSVSLILSKGVDNRIYVPDLQYLSEDEAVKKLKQNNIKYKIEYTYDDVKDYNICDNTNVKDRIVYQSIVGRTELEDPIVNLIINKQSIILNNFPTNSYMRNNYSSYCSWDYGAFKQNFYFTNRSDKTIKYIEFYIYFKNRVKDEILKNGVLSTMQSNYTGPLYAGQSDYAIWENYLVSKDAYYWYLQRIKVIFSDGTTQIISGNSSGWQIA